ncbi:MULTISPECIES: winged helix-turn-helix transcriptional regulator [Herbaspirillum]|uniref:Helix-turn-helix domain-containing protein n=1 Tax=Herbaspirillum huttiense subsp. lycopersici TaxID=3074428 RepID=A0ABU2ELS9_9BURK|nr:MULTISPECIES: helix-turn-helix domain-containing protein [Herbaspirillum]MBP1317377.1 DNA-binding HxlR family transcriptional regulator [Herbaspirillum sp. 1130]MDR6741395.1 DNA-binding HxlR family transcriptional regulator [Herbaspirillum sp. 1173]MDR9849104.1 helix-turn-helix domain-containing protein [Herbaspirillum huttiense SE1]
MESTPPCAPDLPVALHALQCPVEHWLSFLGHRWTAVILWHLREDKLRHAELLSRLPGITAKVLGERMSALGDAGLLVKYEGGHFPRTTHYALTEKAEALLQILDQIDLWSKSHGAAQPACLLPQRPGTALPES